VHFVFAAADGLYVGSCHHCVDFDGSLRPKDGWFLAALPNRTVDPATTPPDADIVWVDPLWNTGADVTHDVAVLKVRQAMWWAVSPDLPTWGGATGLHDQPGVDPGPVRQAGRGSVLGGTAAEARQGVLLDWDGSARFSYTGDAQPGDSGSPVLDASNRAVGYVTHGAGTSGDNASPGERGLVHGIHLQHFLATVEAATGLRLRLVLAGEDPVEVHRTLAAEASRDQARAEPAETPGLSAAAVAALLATAALVARRARQGR
jgi:hypothetical protein